jgi:hypothetical protein
MKAELLSVALDEVITLIEANQAACSDLEAERLEAEGKVKVMRCKVKVIEDIIYEKHNEYDVLVRAKDSLFELNGFSTE